jgi:hypothetical protein
MRWNGRTHERFGGTCFYYDPFSSSDAPLRKGSLGVRDFVGEVFGEHSSLDFQSDSSIFFQLEWATSN